MPPRIMKVITEKSNKNIYFHILIKWNYVLFAFSLVWKKNETEMEKRTVNYFIPKKKKFCIYKHIHVQ